MYLDFKVLYICSANTKNIHQGITAVLFYVSTPLVWCMLEGLNEAGILIEDSV